MLLGSSPRLDTVGSDEPNPGALRITFPAVLRTDLLVSVFVTSSLPAKYRNIDRMQPLQAYCVLWLDKCKRVVVVSQILVHVLRLFVRTFTNFVRTDPYDVNFVRTDPYDVNHRYWRCFFQFEIIINVSVSSFWFRWIPKVWVYTAIINIRFLWARGPSLYVRIWRLQTSDSDV